MGQHVGSNKGMIDSMVGFITEKTMSKPQRVKAVRNYVEGSLSPEFKSNLQNVSQSLINTICCNLHDEASVLIGQKTESLNQLKQELKEKKNIFESRIEQLRNFKTILLTF